MKVFIVEDNSLTRFTIKTAVEKIKHEVMGEADCFKDATEKLRGITPDILLLDVILPDKSGLEVLKNFRKTNAKTRVIIITALEQDSLDQELMAEGANHILRKPFSVDELEQAINKALK
ncbi:MAG: hypothetical protein COT17_00770 [Elusimicrobia bacterium CG08_land_8_20_14_0_20_51_18]|nr:MAG: hypothetical protein COT17_00770 [Elusimicrobia bacterium CG08_land_8_20_14_0_20_51_18]